MVARAPRKKMYRTMQGRMVDIEKLRAANESVRAVGNMNDYARGDVLGVGGKIETHKANVIKLYAQWSDVGNWGALRDIEEKDKKFCVGDEEKYKRFRAKVSLHPEFRVNDNIHSDWQCSKEEAIKEAKLINNLGAQELVVQASLGKMNYKGKAGDSADIKKNFTVLVDVKG